MTITGHVRHPDKEQYAISSRQPKKLARRVARFASEMRDLLMADFASHTVPASIATLLTSLRETLASELPMQQFADTAAQTLAYGLFAARYYHSEGPFYASGGTSQQRVYPGINWLPGGMNAALGPPYESVIDEFVSFLAETDVRSALAQIRGFSHEDALMHFYELFLQAYDPRMRAERGVYYTPGPVVSYMIRGVDYLLRSRFGRPNGLLDSPTAGDQSARSCSQAESGVVVCDPACGTGIFLRGVLDFMRASYMRSEDGDAWRQALRAEILPRLTGSELLGTPYAIARMGLVAHLAALDLPEQERLTWAYALAEDEELRLYLGDTDRKSVV